MGRKRKQLIYNEVEITDIGSEGKSIAKVNGVVVFLENAIPGDVVDIRVTRKKKNFQEGKAIKFHKYSDKRVEHFCSHFGTCGGCKWQNLSYDDQLIYKHKQVVDAFERIGKVKPKEMLDILPSEKTQFYRNKLEYTFCNYRWLENIDMDKENLQMNGLGFHVPKMFNRIVDIDKCYLQTESSNDIRLAVRDYAIENNLDFFNHNAGEGLLRNLVVRTSSTGELMVIVIFYREEKENRVNLLNFLKTKFPEITSLVYVINGKKNDSYSDLEMITYHGKDSIIEKLGDISYIIGPKSFFQTNTTQANELYRITKEFASLSDNDIVYDLYTGTGSIANYVARSAKKIVGIEYVEDAIIDARKNSELNNITNTVFYAGDMKDVLNTDFVNKNEKPSVIITDPPRAGMHKDVVDCILEVKPKRIVYVSCNPSTQARDIELLSDDYDVIKVQPVDMFPHTRHVENVALLEIKN